MRLPPTSSPTASIDTVVATNLDEAIPPSGIVIRKAHWMTPMGKPPRTVSPHLAVATRVRGAWAYMVQENGDYDKAEQIWLRALAIDERLFGKDTVETTRRLQRVLDECHVVRLAEIRPTAVETFLTGLTESKRSPR